MNYVKTWFKIGERMVEAREYKKQFFKGKEFVVVKGTLHPDYSYYTFEQEERNFREKYWDIKENDVVFDVGSSYGSYSLSACALGATVYAFEPEKLVFNDLILNININNWHNKCFGYNFGLHSSEKEIDFAKEASHWPQFAISSLYKMRMLDDIVVEQKISRLDWIKIDVEGAEEHVIIGGKNTIQKLHPKLIVECHTFMDKEIVSKVKYLLSSLGQYEYEEIERSECILLVAK
jgi:FkbM family methyltransferase